MLGKCPTFRLARPENGDFFRSIVTLSVECLLMINLRSLWFTGLLGLVGLPFQAAASPVSHIHVIVSLVDNVSQGIVPVPAKIGNGNDTRHNLYWGAAYGVKTFLSKAKGWRQLGCENDINDTILERCRFVWENRLTVTAEAYRGSRIDRAMLDFMREAATPPPPAQREMVVFIGHDGLMDEASQPIVEYFPKHPKHDKQAVVLACLSDEYFTEHLQAAGSLPVVTTFSFMAPEAYVLEAVARGFANRASEEELRSAAASAYAKYQHISAKAGNSVFGAKNSSGAIKLSLR
jgi:hypothetical protein